MMKTTMKLFLFLAVLHAFSVCSFEFSIFFMDKTMDRDDSHFQCLAPCSFSKGMFVIVKQNKEAIEEEKKKELKKKAENEVFLMTFKEDIKDSIELKFSKFHLDTLELLKNVVISQAALQEIHALLDREKNSLGEKEEEFLNIICQGINIHQLKELCSSNPYLTKFFQDIIYHRAHKVSKAIKKWLIKLGKKIEDIKQKDIEEREIVQTENELEQDIEAQSERKTVKEQLLGKDPSERKTIKEQLLGRDPQKSKYHRITDLAQELNLSMVDNDGKHENESGSQMNVEQLCIQILNIDHILRHIFDEYKKDRDITWKQQINFKCLNTYNKYISSPFRLSQLLSIMKRLRTETRDVVSTDSHFLKQYYYKIKNKILSFRKDKTRLLKELRLLRDKHVTRLCMTRKRLQVQDGPMENDKSKVLNLLDTTVDVKKFA